jgi:hypothetical protein
MPSPRPRPERQSEITTVAAVGPSRYCRCAQHGVSLSGMTRIGAGARTSRHGVSHACHPGAKFSYWLAGSVVSCSTAQALSGWIAPAIGPTPSFASHRIENRQKGSASVVHHQLFLGASRSAPPHATFPTPPRPFPASLALRLSLPSLTRSTAFFIFFLLQCHCFSIISLPFLSHLYLFTAHLPSSSSRPLPTKTRGFLHFVPLPQPPCRIASNFLSHIRFA